MKRKVSLIGPSTLMVSLPSKWVKKYGIKKGDELDIDEKGSVLHVGTKAEKEGQSARIDLEKEGLFFKRYLHVLYKYGYDKINITSPDKLNMTELQIALNEMEGFEIFDQKEKACTIKSISTGLNTEFDNVLRRIFQINLTMAEESLINIRLKSYEKLNDVVTLENNNNKLVNFCQRYLNKRGYKESYKTSSLYVFLEEMEMIADFYRDICKFTTENKLTISKETLLLYEGVNEIYRSIYSLFYKFDFEEMPSLKTKRLKKLEEVKRLLITKKGKELLIISYLFNLLNIYHHLELLLFYV